MNEKMIDEITASLQMTILALSNMKEAILEMQRNNAEMKALIDSIMLIRKEEKQNESAV